MKAIVAAGGSGTRLRPLTFSSNKHLLPIANKPLLLFPIEAIADTGIKEIGVVVNETRPAIESLLGDGSRWGLHITYIDQAKPLGLAHVVKICQEFLAGQPFVYHLGDNIFTQGIKRPFAHFERTQPDALLTMIEHPENNRLGVPFFDAQGNLEKVVEKPQNPPNRFGIPGLYFFNHHVFEAFEGNDSIKPSARGELEITDLYTYLLAHKFRVETEELEGEWMDPGKFDDMLTANRKILDLKTSEGIEGTIDDDSKVEGPVLTGPGSAILGSRLTGPIIIGDNVVIDNCRIGPYVSIANDCRLNNVTILNSIVMEHTTIENVQGEIVDSMIGKQTRVWEENKATTSLFIGDYCSVRLT